MKFDINLFGLVSRMSLKTIDDFILLIIEGLVEMCCLIDLKLKRVQTINYRYKILKKQNLNMNKADIEEIPTIIKCS